MRIYIVLSTIFLISTSFYGLGKRGEDIHRIYSIYFNSCETSNKISPSNQTSCYDYASSQVKESGLDSPLVYLGIYSFLPLFFIWVLGTIFYKVFLWIKVGFQNKS